MVNKLSVSSEAKSLLDKRGLNFQNLLPSEKTCNLAKVIVDTDRLSFVGKGLTKFFELLDGHKNKEEMKKEEYDVLKISIKGGDIIDKVSYDIWFHLTDPKERFIYEDHFATKNKVGDYSLRIFNELITMGKFLNCHSLYSYCHADELDDDAYNNALLGFDFDAYNESGIKMRGEENNFIMNENRLQLQGTRNVSSLYELLHQEGGREYWKNNHFSFQGKFDLTPGSTSLQRFETYKAPKNFSGSSQ